MQQTGDFVPTLEGDAIDMLPTDLFIGSGPLGPPATMRPGFRLPGHRQPFGTAGNLPLDEIDLTTLLPMRCLHAGKEKMKRDGVMEYWRLRHDGDDRIRIHGGHLQE